MNYYQLILDQLPRVIYAHRDDYRCRRLKSRNWLININRGNQLSPEDVIDIERFS